MALEPQNLYHQIGRLIETMPDLTANPLSVEAHQWIGRADALIQHCEDRSVRAQWGVLLMTFHSSFMGRTQNIEELKQLIYRALASAELYAPAGVKGAFIPVGNSFDAFAAVAKLLGGAKKDVFIVDPYLDETALTEFGQAVPDGAVLRLLTDEKHHKATLPPAAEKWTKQYGAKRPLAVRLALPSAIHDRAIFIDGVAAWTLTQSLKDFAKRAPAEIVRADDTAALKIAAYEAIWRTARVVA